MEIFGALAGVALVFLSFSFIVNGFPNIHIGSKNYYSDKNKKL